jgi:hypothetical protein
MTPDQVKLVQQSFAQVAPIADTAAGIFYDRLYDLDFAEPVDDDGERRHQLAALLRHVAVKQRPDGGRGVEQPVVEQGGRRIRDGRDLDEALLHRPDLIGVHYKSPRMVVTPPSTMP